jgi:hypothetical protein
MPKAYINTTNNLCSDLSPQYEYINTGINSWYSPSKVSNYISLGTNIDLSLNTLNNNCNNILLSDLNTTNNLNNSIKLSQDNTNLMSGCDFNSGINSFTGNSCTENMEDVEGITLEPSSSIMEKGYLICFSILIIGILFKASIKLDTRRL